MRSTLFESQARASYKIADGLRDQYLTWRGERSHARSDVYGNTGKVIAHRLTLARVNSAAYLQANRAHSLANRTGAADCTCRTVECGEQAVTGSVDLPPAEYLQHLANFAIERL